MNRNHNDTNVKECALLVLTLIAAGEGDHPAVRKTLKSILSRLDEADTDFQENDFVNSQHPDVIPFKSGQTKKSAYRPRMAPPRFKIYSPCDDEELVKNCPQAQKSPQLSVYAD